MLFYSHSSVPCHWSCSVSSRLEQQRCGWSLYNKTSAETRCICNQWLFTRMGFLCGIRRDIGIISVLSVIGTSWEIYLKWFGSRWDFRWKNFYSFSLESDFETSMGARGSAWSLSLCMLTSANQEPFWSN